MLNPVLDELLTDIDLQQVTATSAGKIKAICDTCACATCKHALIATYPRASVGEALHVDVLIYCDKRCADVYDTADEHLQRPVGSCSGAAYNDDEDMDEDGGDAD